MPFISLSCLIALARTASTMNQSDESKHSYPIPDLRGKALGFSPLCVILALGFSYVSFITLL